MIQTSLTKATQSASISSYIITSCFSKGVLRFKMVQAYFWCFLRANRANHGCQQRVLSTKGQYGGLHPFLHDQHTATFRADGGWAPEVAWTRFWCWFFYGFCMLFDCLFDPDSLKFDGLQLPHTSKFLSSLVQDMWRRCRRVWATCLHSEFVNTSQCQVLSSDETLGHSNQLMEAPEGLATKPRFLGHRDRRSRNEIISAGGSHW